MLRVKKKRRSFAHSGLDDAGCPPGLGTHHRIQDREELPHAGDQRHLLALPLGDQVPIEGRQGRVVAHPGERRHVQGRPDGRPSTPATPAAPQGAAVPGQGRLYADKAGLQVICLRIGLFRDRPQEERHLAVWISPADMARLVRCAIEAPGIRYEVVYGISNNTRRFWDLRRAREVLGYEPQDDAEAYAAALLQDPSEGWAERVGRIGGSKCELPFMP